MGSEPEAATREDGGGNAIAAFVVTPFIAGALWGVYTCALLLTIDRLEARAAATFLIGGLTFGAAFAAFVTWFIAVPCYFVARATIGVDGRVSRITGATIGALIGFWLTATGGGYPSPIGGGFIGWLVAAIWWRMANGSTNDSLETAPSHTDKCDRKRTWTT
jgi:hypothetical protein